MTASTVVDQIQLGDHVCWTHEDESDALDTVGRFAATGLRLGQKVICFTDTATPQSVRARVDALGVPTQDAVAGGQLRIVPALEVYLSGGRLAPEAMVATVVDEITRAGQEGYPGVRLVGDMAWVLRTGTTLDDLHRYESALNPLFLDGRVAGMCLYDRRLFPAERVRALAAAHLGTAGSHLHRTWSPLLRAYRTTDPPGLRLVGQVDQSNREAFTAVLDDVTTDPRNVDRATVVDLSEVSFVDAGAATALVRAGQAGAAGVRLVGCRPALGRLIGLLGGAPGESLPA
ncbi:MEDS domain-containing protein [Micromonospora auratinigra]|uniref:MEDS: MEthanogen/methylotroph, DcmR Sensory domain n=1 Tax=Micromonospora auratinigra TaxID=261654 RepID=A0A1A8ZBM5_9ACTN|nr:MEDS domain-containing protein [Micromonospora auratinigra]SBT41203.1 MEDS: MEthanogen/methylotroph, DcmR Sensory domain [Micromonospora auratinigra]